MYITSNRRCVDSERLRRLIRPCPAPVKAAHFAADSALMDARNLLHGLTPTDIAARFPVSLSTARRWKKTGRLSPLALAYVELILDGDLKHFGPGWQGWKVRTKIIELPEGILVTGGQIRAIPVRLAQIHALQRALATPEQRALF